MTRLYYKQAGLARSSAIVDLTVVI